MQSKGWAGWVSGSGGLITFATQGAFQTHRTIYTAAAPSPHHTLRTSEGIFPSGCLIGWVVRFSSCPSFFFLIFANKTSCQRLCITEVLTVPMNCVMEILQMACSGHKIIVPLHHISQTSRSPNILSSSP